MLKIAVRTFYDVGHRKPTKDKSKNGNDGRFVADVTISDFHRYFKYTYNIDIELKVFDAVIDEYNLRIAEDILNGQVVKLYPRLGKIMIMEKPMPKITRDSEGNIKARKDANMVDWNLTKKLGLRNKVTGKLIPQYRERQTEYCITKWIKEGLITNLYFTMFRTGKNFRRKIPAKLRENDTLHINYKENYTWYQNLRDKK